jgi:FkbM family methyltransferase
MAIKKISGARSFEKAIFFAWGVLFAASTMYMAGFQSCAPAVTKETQESLHSKDFYRGDRKPVSPVKQTEGSPESGATHTLCNCSTPSIASTPSITSTCNSITSDMIFPIMREWGCGHKNMETPRILLPQVGGRDDQLPPFGNQRVVIDVGLGQDAGETFSALEQEFIIFAFEPDGGNMAFVRKKASQHPDKFHFVEVKPGQAPDLSKLPQPPAKGGFVYLFYAALGASISRAGGSGSGNVGGVDTNAAGNIPVVTLDSCIPDWVSSVYLIKIDTQGFELQVLNGAQGLIERVQPRYILYEYSPYLMNMHNYGNVTELLHKLPDMGYMCFDMMGSHLALPRPSWPINTYRDSLYAWRRAEWGFPKKLGQDSIGPWDDIMCANLRQMQSDREPGQR